MTGGQLKTARDHSRDMLRDLIVHGTLAPESPLEEVKLSAEIGVSRTPVREALIALEQEGLVQSRAHHGFSVVGADAKLVRDSFHIMAALESQALRLAFVHSAVDVAALRDLNDSLPRATTKARRYELDLAFHRALTDGCGNERLLLLLRMERSRIALVDGAHRRGMADLDGSVRGHEAVLQSIERGDIDTAAAELADHWENGIEVVSNWLQQSAR